MFTQIDLWIISLPACSSVIIGQENVLFCFDLLYPICIRPVVHFGLLLNYYSFLDQHDGKKKKMNE